MSHSMPGRIGSRFTPLSTLPVFSPRPSSEEYFTFHGKALNGIPQLHRTRWERGVDITSAALGELVGKLYVARYFPPEVKAKVQAMVDDLKKAFGNRIEALTWMSPATKAKAKEKLATLIVGVGYPDHWQDYTSLQIIKGDASATCSATSCSSISANWPSFINRSIAASGG